MTDRTAIKPFKGLNYYEEADKDIFYGRGREAKELADLVELNPLTLVFGKSGIGKTSLLNAGLFPLLRGKNYLPIRIRLDYSSDGLPLLQQVKTEMARQFDAHHITLIPKSKVESDEEPLIKNFRKVQETLSQKGFLAVEDNESLWQIFRRFDFHLNQGTQAPVPVTPVLVFDQFEEFFTLGKHHPQREELIDELYWLIEDQVPPALEERIFNRQESFPYLREYSTFRVVIGLREDYLPHMDELKQRIPSLHRVLYRVIHLNGIQAREVMDRAGVFSQESITQDILDQFYPEDIEPGKVTPEKLEVEPALFSLLCDRVYETKVSELTRQAKDEILEDFYLEILDSLPQGKELDQWVEKHLLTDGGFRTPYYLERQSPIREVIEAAIDKKLLRKLYIGDKEHVEIIHDVLASVIHLRKRLKEFHLSRTWTALSFVLAIIALFLSILSFVLKNQADEQYNIASCNRLASEAELEQLNDSTKAIRIAEAAYKIGLPEPPAQVTRALCSAAYSTRGRLFYNFSMYHNGGVTCAAFSPDGKEIVTASSDGTAKVWDIKGNLLVDLKGHTGGVNTAVFSPDGQQIVTASDDGTAKVWDLKGNPRVDLKGHEGSFKSAQFSPDGVQIVTASDFGDVKVWNLKGTLLAELKGSILHVFSAQFSPDSKHIVTASWDKTAKVWDVNGTLLAELKGHTRWVKNAVFSPDGKQIVTASYDGTAKVWDVKGTLLADLKGHAGIVYSALFSPDGKQIVTASMDGTAKVWDIKDNILIELKGHTDRVNSAQFSPDGKQLVTASYDGTAKVWDLKGNLLADLKGHKGSVNSAQFSPNGQQIVTASIDGTAKVWDVKGSLLAILKGHSDSVHSAVFSPDGQQIVTASDDKSAKVWDIKGNLLSDLKGHTGFVYSAIFSPDSKQIVTTSYDKTAKIWELKRTLLTELKGHTDSVYSAEFSPDGKYIVTASKDGTAKVWDLKGNLLADMKGHTDRVNSAVFSPDGKRIVTASEDGTAIIWPMPESIIEWLKTAPIPKLTVEEKKELGIDKFNID